MGLGELLELAEHQGRALGDLVEQERDQVALVGQQLVEALVMKREPVADRVVFAEQALLVDGDALDVDDLAVHEVEQRGRRVVAADAAHAPDEAHERRRERGLRDVAPVLRLELRLGLAAVLEVEHHHEDQCDQWEPEADGTPSDGLDARPEALAIGLVSPLLLCGQDAGLASARRRLRPGEGRSGEQDAALNERLRRQGIDGHDHTRVGRDGHIAPERSVRPGAHLVAGDAGGQVDGDAHEIRRHRGLIADELPVQFSDVVPALRGAPRDVVDAEPGRGVAHAEEEQDAHALLAERRHRIRARRPCLHILGRLVQDGPGAVGAWSAGRRHVEAV